MAIISALILLLAVSAASAGALSKRLLLHTEAQPQEAVAATELQASSRTLLQDSTGTCNAKSVCAAKKLTCYPTKAQRCTNNLCFSYINGTYCSCQFTSFVALGYDPNGCIMESTIQGCATLYQSYKSKC